MNQRDRLFDFVKRHIFGTRDINQCASRPFDRIFLEQLRIDRRLHRFDRRAFARSLTDAHQRHAHSLHDGFDVGKVEIDNARHGYQIRNALNGLKQYIVGAAKSVHDRDFLLDFFEF